MSISPPASRTPLDASAVRGQRPSRDDDRPPATVLVVEDEQIVALEIKDRLTRMGHAVVAAVGSGEQAIELARRLRPSLVLMDIKLQGEIDGIEAATAIRRDADIPVIFLTAFADEPTLQRAKLAEPYGYILKPFQSRELHAIIEVTLERHHIARRLRENEAFQSALLQNVGDAVVATGANGRVRLLNARAEAFTGWTAAEAIGRPLDEVVEIVQTPERRSGVWRDPTCRSLVARDGTRRPLEASFTPIRDASGAVLGTVVVLRDITERKRLQDRQRLMAVVSGEVSSSLDRDAILARVAPLLARSLGDWCAFHLRDADGRRFALALVGHRNPAREPWTEPARRSDAGADEPAPRAIAQVVRSGCAVLEAALSDPRQAAAALGVSPALAAASFVVAPLTSRGQVLGTLTIARERPGHPLTDADRVYIEEIGQRVAAAIDNAQSYADAQRALRTRDEVLAIVSHDLRNPLSSIRLNADQLLRASGPLSRERVLAAGAAIRRVVDVMNRLIGDLLDVATIDSGRLAIRPEPHEASGLFAEAVAMSSGTAGARAITLVSEGPPPGARVRCDRERVLQVLSNLVENALKFSPERATVVVRGEVDTAVLRVSVADHAGGIAPEDVAHIFERYWRVPGERRKGSGLGLYISKAIVEAHGGRIWVESTPGVGSTFTFTLPLVAAAG